LLNGGRINYPQTAGVNRTFKPAPRIVRRVAEQLHAFDESG
jgi:hypothetical protein